jgi:hypothetical protein
MRLLVVKEDVSAKGFQEVTLTQTAQKQTFINPDVPVT